jgi:hypothetical protein
MIQCMLFLRDSNSLERKEGLGIHPFSRVPIAGEHISLSSESVVYKVTHVHHTGFSSNHTTELYVLEADDIKIVAGDPIPMPYSE